MSWLWSAVRFVLVAYLLAAIVLYTMQDRFLLPGAPQTAGLGVGHHAEADVQLWYPAGTYAGYVVTPVERDPVGTVVVYHGNAESAQDKLALAFVFVRRGFRAVLVEYPGYGRRPGPRTMRAALAASRSALSDARAQWPGRLFVVGDSLGAGMAAQAVAGNERSIAGVLLITPWDSLASVSSAKLRVFPVRWMLRDSFDSVDALRHYTGPVVVIGAGRDAVIPVSHAERLARLHPGARFLLLPDAGHNDWFSSMTENDWHQALRWLGVSDTG